MYSMFGGFILIQKANFLIGYYMTYTVQSLWGLQPNKINLHYNLGSLVV